MQKSDFLRDESESSVLFWGFFQFFYAVFNANWISSLKNYEQIALIDKKRWTWTP